MYHTLPVTQVKYPAFCMRNGAQLCSDLSLPCRCPIFPAGHVIRLHLSSVLENLRRSFHLNFLRLWMICENHTFFLLIYRGGVDIVRCNSLYFRRSKTGCFSGGISYEACKSIRLNVVVPAYRRDAGTGCLGPDITAYNGRRPH